MDELTWLQQGESMLRHTSSLKGVLIVATEISSSPHKNDLNREKRQKFQHKGKEIMSRYNKSGRGSTS